MGARRVYEFILLIMKLINVVFITLLAIGFTPGCSRLDGSVRGKQYPDGHGTNLTLPPGQSLPGGWRPFHDDSPWNKPIPAGAEVHPLSGNIIDTMAARTPYMRFGNSYLVPVWVVNSDEMSFYPARSSYPFDIWDIDNDFVPETGVPLSPAIWGEQTEDGHIVIIDTTYHLSWEMSRFKGIVDDTIRCSTFNVWDLTGPGTGNPGEGKRWRSRGGRGSGFPNIAGLVRPEEILAGEIRHALAFTSTRVKKDEFYYPASRSDGKHEGSFDPAEGMLFQLNPALGEADFRSWGLSEGAVVVALALQKYGMYLCDVGGDFALQVQLLDADSDRHRSKWDSLSPGLYSTVSRIPVNEFRLIHTGEPLAGGTMEVVTTPLIMPQCGTFSKEVVVSMAVNQHWPGAEIRYTLDGSDPTPDSRAYNGPFKLSESAEVKAVAFHPGGKESRIMRAPIIIR